MRNLTWTTILAILVIGCASIEIQQTSPITPGQIFVEKFTGPAGGIVTNALEMEFQKKELLTTRDQAKYILTGNTLFRDSVWDEVYSTIIFDLKDKEGNLYLRGNWTTAYMISPTAAGKDVAKKICKKSKKDY